MARVLALGLLALCCAAPDLAQAQAAARETIIVDPDEFRCLLTDLDRVPSERKGILVDISSCRRDGGVKLRRLFVPMPTRNTGGVETLIFVDRPRLECLRRYRRDAVRLLERLPDNRYRARLEPCGR